MAVRTNIGISVILDSRPNSADVQQAINHFSAFSSYQHNPSLMFNRKSFFGAIALAALFAAYPHFSLADSFKSSDFLTWQKKSQVFYIEASIGMASLIAAQNNKSQAKCIDDWYYSEEKAKNAFILETMKRAPGYHPRGVILAVIEKQCTPLVYK